MPPPPEVNWCKGTCEELGPAASPPAPTVSSRLGVHGLQGPHEVAIDSSDELPVSIMAGAGGGILALAGVLWVWQRRAARRDARRQRQQAAEVAAAEEAAVSSSRSGMCSK